LYFAGISPHESNEFCDASCWQLGIDGKHLRQGDRERYGFEVVVGIVRDLGAERWVDDIGIGGDEDGVAIGRGPRSLRGADGAACTREVLNVELLGELFAKLLRQQTGEHVVRAARCKWHNDAHRPRRVVERPCAL